MVDEERMAITEDEIRLSDSILSKLKVINDTPEVPFEPEALVVPDEELATIEEEQELVETEPVQDQVLSPEECVLSWDEIDAVRNRANRFSREVQLLLNDLPDDSAVVNSVKEYCYNEYNRILRTIPVEHLNNRKVGIRVSALRAAGYGSIYKLKDLTYSQLLQINGIGEKSANLILQEIGLLCSYAKEQVIVRPTINYGANIVSEYYQFEELGKFHNQMVLEFEDIYREFITLNKNLRKIKFKLIWFYTSSKKKKALSDYAKEMEAFLNETLLECVTHSLEEQQRIHEVSLETCFAAYYRQRSLYDAAFDSYKSFSKK